MLLNSFVGKTLLWHGQPFLARTWFEPTPSDFDSAGLNRRAEISTPYAKFKLVHPEGTSPESTVPNSISSLPIDIIGVDTSMLNPGVYEVSLARGDQQLSIPELVWVLSREDYAKLAKFELAEREMPEPLISGRHELIRNLNGIRKTRWPDAPLGFEVIYGATVPFSFGRVEGLVSTVLENFRYVAVFGVASGANATISINDESFEFGIQGKLEYPLPIEVERAISDPECSDLLLMQNARAMQGENIEFGIQIEGGQAQIRVQHSMPILDYA
jgi:hypothetical protein